MLDSINMESLKFLLNVVFPFRSHDAVKEFDLYTPSNYATMAFGTDLRYDDDLIAKYFNIEV